MSAPQLTSHSAGQQALRREPSLTSPSPWLRLRSISARLRAVSTALKELNGAGFSQDSLVSSGSPGTHSTMPGA